MSVSSLSPAARPVGNQFFDQLPEEMVRLIFKFLKPERGSLSIGSANDRAIVATSAVCRNWQANPILEEERQEARIRLRQRVNLQNLHLEIRLLNEYPPEMVQAFRNSHMPIFQLPVLDLGNRQGETDYIDFLQPEEMDQSVMRFRDCLDRPGIALKIRANYYEPDRKRELLGQALSRIETSMRSAVQMQDFSQFRFVQGIDFLRNWNPKTEIVLATFKRYTSPESTQWSLGWGNSNTTIQSLYNQRHDENGDHVVDEIMDCPNCPFVNRQMNVRVLSDLLNGRDPDFSLPGHNAVRSRNQTAARNTSQRTIVATLTDLALASFVNYYLIPERDENL